MFIVYYTDCMSISPAELDCSEYYPQLVKRELSDISYEVFAQSGATTTDSLSDLDKIIGLGPELVIYAYGVNDALPRGLQRETRAKLIRYMYNMKLNHVQRLWARKYLLNPLEYISQLIRPIKQYVALDESRNNFLNVMNSCKQSNIDLVVLNIAPVKNYRFINSDKFINNYNDMILAICNEHNVRCIDVFQLFKNEKSSLTLATDQFHYGLRGHVIVSQEIIKSIID